MAQAMKIVQRLTRVVLRPGESHVTCTLLAPVSPREPSASSLRRTLEPATNDELVGTLNLTGTNHLDALGFEVWIAGVIQQRLLILDNSALYVSYNTIHY